MIAPSWRIPNGQEVGGEWGGVTISSFYITSDHLEYCFYDRQGANSFSQSVVTATVWVLIAHRVGYMLCMCVDVLLCVCGYVLWCVCVLWCMCVCGCAVVSVRIYAVVYVCAVVCVWICALYTQSVQSYVCIEVQILFGGLVQSACRTWSQMVLDGVLKLFRSLYRILWLGVLSMCSFAVSYCCVSRAVNRNAHTPKTKPQEGEEVGTCVC